MSNIISKEYAIKLGLKRFFTGIPCKYGHIDERFVSTRRCVTCCNISRNKHRAENKDKYDQQLAEWCEKNKTKVAEYDKERYHDNKQYHRDKRNRWHKNNPHRGNEWSAARRARKLSQTPEMTESEKQEIKNIYYRAWCYSQVEIWNFHVDHVIPLAKGGLHHPSNLQVLEATQNLVKGVSIK
jgi:hypothetical protein